MLVLQRALYRQCSEETEFQRWLGACTPSRKSFEVRSLFILWRYRMKRRFYCVKAQFEDGRRAAVIAESRVAEIEPKDQIQVSSGLTKFLIWMSFELSAITLVELVNVMAISINDLASLMVARDRRRAA